MDEARLYGRLLRDGPRRERPPGARPRPGISRTQRNGSGETSWHSFLNQPELTLLGGSVSIIVDRQVVGGIGSSGGTIARTPRSHAGLAAIPRKILCQVPHPRQCRRASTCAPSRHRSVFRTMGHSPRCENRDQPRRAERHLRVGSSSSTSESIGESFLVGAGGQARNPAPKLSWASRSVTRDRVLFVQYQGDGFDDSVLCP
jgi:hypothetical protein